MDGERELHAAEERPQRGHDALACGARGSAGQASQAPATGRKQPAQHAEHLQSQCMGRLLSSLARTNRGGLKYRSDCEGARARTPLRNERWSNHGIYVISAGRCRELTRETSQQTAAPSHPAALTPQQRCFEGSVVCTRRAIRVKNGTFSTSVTKWAAERAARVIARAPSLSFSRCAENPPTANRDHIIHSLSEDHHVQRRIEARC